MNIRQNHETVERQKQGISSFDLIDSKLVFKELNLQKGSSFIDIGSGAGDYAVTASSIVGNTGIVYALDQWEEIAFKLDQRVISQKIQNVKTLTANITETLPFEDNSCDVCFMAMVIHGIDLSIHGEIFFSELFRILKPKGRIAIIEMKKEKTSFGPPLDIRLSPIELEDITKKYKFKKISYTDLGFSYLIQFESEK